MDDDNEHLETFNNLLNQKLAQMRMRWFKMPQDPYDLLESYVVYNRSTTLEDSRLKVRTTIFASLCQSVTKKMIPQLPFKRLGITMTLRKGKSGGSLFVWNFGR